MHRRVSIALLVAALSACAHPAQAPQPADTPEVARWKAEAQQVTITRDDWGIAHVRGHTDADAVFGMIYAQAEDDFNRVEYNYLTSLGRHAQAFGDTGIWSDLRQRLFVNDDTLKALYGQSPVWLQSLMNSWADGLNYYLYTHPDVKPKAITRFEPWMALSFTEGSIGGDIESISLGGLQALYSQANPRPPLDTAPAPVMKEPGGSNGIAIAPQNTVDHHALLLINPHTSFFFRSELQMTSDEGLNAYGASTWGQFFVYQGFNDRLGWMHTSSGVDDIDEFAEAVTQHDGRLWYRYGGEEREVTQRTITIPYKTGGGTTSREFTVYFTHHGPIVREANGRWIAVSLMNKPIPQLEQSYLRTKARSLAEYRKVMELRANSSNNTLYADADGNIGYFHPQFVPKRDDRFDYTHPVNGADPATDWHGEHALSELPTVINPPNGWVYNSNNGPWSAAGPNSPNASDYPRYMDQVGEGPRGIHALRVLTDRHDFTIARLRDAAFDSWLPVFARLVPKLVAAYDSLGSVDPMKAQLAEQVSTLRNWDERWGVASVPTSLAVYWGEDLMNRSRRGASRRTMTIYDYMADSTSGTEKLASLAAASDRLTRDFGTWKTPWGEINRFQRLTGDIVQPFNDAAPSIPVPFTSALWGSLASFGARTYPGTKRMYGTSGNSFVAVVQFGDSVHAIAVTAGGESGHPSSPHFNDEASRYASGNLRTVYFYPNQLVGHTERVYRPGAK